MQLLKVDKNKHKLEEVQSKNSRRSIVCYKKLCGEEERKTASLKTPKTKFLSLKYEKFNCFNCFYITQVKLSLFVCNFNKDVKN